MECERGPGNPRYDRLGSDALSPGKFIIEPNAHLDHTIGGQPRRRRVRLATGNG
jgi:hypothetical protein